MREVLQVHPDDNVVVALQSLQAGQVLQLELGELRLAQDIPPYHKVALRPLSCNEAVYKYGQVIGCARSDISPGEHVHTHNLATQLSGSVSATVSLYSEEAHQQALAYWEEKRQYYSSNKWKGLAPSFSGYQRSGQHPSAGGVGVRNEIWVLSMVQCVNESARHMVAEFLQRNPLPPNIDGIYHFPHPYGCSQLGDDLAHTRKILQAMCQHPNAGGILLLGLGCENNILERFCSDLPCAAIGAEHNEGRICSLLTQDCEDEIECGISLLEELVQIAATDYRSEVSISQLKVGLKCGGSDGLSGLSANPLLGQFSDFLIAQGGSTVLGEVPEMFGAEALLLGRANSPKVLADMGELIDNFKRYFEQHGENVSENPSPGNQQGGISTLEDKSLGCVQKGGCAPVMGVHPYAAHSLCEGNSPGGLHLLCTPGNDGVSTSAMAAVGCHILLFTTGRGTPLGTFVPTLKVSSNSALAQRKKNWLDFDGGKMLEASSAEREALLEDFVTLVQATASGKRTRNEEYGFRELSIWKNGVTL